MCSLCSPVSAMPTSGCRSIQGSRCFTRPNRIASGSLPINMASATEIWDWALFSEAGMAPHPTRTRNGSNMRGRTSDGQMQTSSARDVAMTPAQCPTTEAGQTDKNGTSIPYFQKEFFHNGYIKSLKQLVHFYNTRD